LLTRRKAKTTAANNVEEDEDEEQQDDQVHVRIMCLTAFPLPLNWQPSVGSTTATSAAAAAPVTPLLHLVVTGDSAGVIKVWLIDAASSVSSRASHFRLLLESAAHDCTVLSLTHLLLRGSGSASAEDDVADVLLFSGGTDGGVLVWSLRAAVSSALAATSLPFTASSPSSSASAPKAAASSPLEPLLQPAAAFQQHQSGVDCLCAAWVIPADAQDPLAANTINSDSRRHFVLFSGGDDQSLSLCGGSVAPALTSSTSSSSLSSSVPFLLHGLWSCVHPLAHLSAIKGLTFDAATRRLYSVGFDQRLRCWSVQQQPETKTEQAQEGGGGEGGAAAEEGPQAKEAVSPPLALVSLGQAVVDVWDVTTLRAVTVGRTPAAASSDAAPLLAIAGQGMQLLQPVGIVETDQITD
jgi:WD40 repeat protein